jgi:hypothetical protein
MTTLAAIVGYASGFALMRYRGSPADLIATSLTIDVALAPLTALVAARRGRSVVLWSVLGFLFGAWALFWALLVLSVKPARIDPPTPGFPPTSDAA